MQSSLGRIESPISFLHNPFRLSCHTQTDKPGEKPSFFWTRQPSHTHTKKKIVMYVCSTYVVLAQPLFFEEGHAWLCRKIFLVYKGGKRKKKNQAKKYLIIIACLVGCRDLLYVL